MESHKPRAEMNEQEREAVINAGSFCWPTRASLCQLFSERLRYPSGLPLSEPDSRSTEGPFSNQASPTAGTAPDKRPPLRGGIPRHADLRWETDETDE